MRGRALLLLIVLGAVAAAMPLALAARGGASGPLGQLISPPKHDAPTVPTPDAAPVVAKPTRTGGDAIALASSLGAISVGTLALGAWAARRSTRAKIRRAPRKSFESGRRLGRAEGAPSTVEALARLARGNDLMKLASAVERGAGIRVVAQPKRGRSCEQVGGYLTGLMETAWAADVAVYHENCGLRSGLACVYDVVPARGARSAPALVQPISYAGPRAGSPIRESSSAHRRSTAAPRGGS